MIKNPLESITYNIKLGSSGRTKRGSMVRFPRIFIRIVAFLSVFVSLLPQLSAQQPTKPASSTTKRPTKQASSTVIRPVNDSTTLYYILPLAPEKLYTDSDTLPDRAFHMYDPARRQLLDWGHLGNLGTPARPLFFSDAPRRGFDAGLHGFDLYRLQPEAVRFYRNTKSFSEAFFSQGANQLDGLLNARFSRTFAGGTNFILDYRTINNKGQFRHLRAKHNSLALGIWVPIGRRYDGFIVFTNNINRQRDNGGIQTDTVFGKEGFSGPINAPVWLPADQAESRYVNQNAQLVQHLRFVGGAAGKRALRATHTFNYTKNTYKFSDAPLGPDSLFYQTDLNEHFLTETRGVRHYLSVNQFDNTFKISTFKQKTKDRVSDALTVGLSHHFFKIHQEPRDTQLTNLFATGSIAITPSDRFSFTAQGELGLLTNIGEYNLTGDLEFSLGKAGILRGALQSKRYPPTLLQHRFYVTQTPVWDNSFNKPFETSLSATYALPAIGLEATVRTHIVDNFIYFDTKSKPRQLPDALSVSQLIVTENVRLGHFHLDNTFALQQSNRLDSILRLPAWFSKNSLYYAGKLFKGNLDIRLGFDFRMNAAFRPDAYHPLTGQFHLQDTQSQKPYPWVDAFAAIKIQAFRFFFRFENLTYAVDGLLNKPSRVLYYTSRHPQQFPALRLGIAWRFADDNIAKQKTLQDPNAPSDGPSGRSGRPTGTRPEGF